MRSASLHTLSAEGGWISLEHATRITTREILYKMGRLLTDIPFGNRVCLGDSNDESLSNPKEMVVRNG